MKISELIGALYILMTLHGDLAVYVNDTKEDVVELPDDWINVEHRDNETVVYIG